MIECPLMARYGKFLHAWSASTLVLPTLGTTWHLWFWEVARLQQQLIGARTSWAFNAHLPAAQTRQGLVTFAFHTWTELQLCKTIYIYIYMDPRWPPQSRSNKIPKALTSEKGRNRTACWTVPHNDLSRDRSLPHSCSSPLNRRPEAPELFGIIPVDIYNTFILYICL